MNAYGLEDVPPPGWALVEQLDKRLLIQLRDGRKLIGTLRSFDQFANLVIESAVERVIVNTLYTDISIGLHLVRGENVVLMGEVDPDKLVPPGLTQVTEAEIRRAQKAEREEQRLRGTMRARMDFLDPE